MVKWEERGLINSKRKELVHGELVKQVPDNLLLPTEIARVYKKGTRKKKKKKIQSLPKVQKIQKNVSVGIFTLATQVCRSCAVCQKVNRKIICSQSKGGENQ